MGSKPERQIPRGGRARCRLPRSWDRCDGFSAMSMGSGARHARRLSASSIWPSAIPPAVAEVHLPQHGPLSGDEAAPYPVLADLPVRE
jgi:hypothetical protein